MKLPKPADSSADFVVVDEGVYKMELTKYEGPLLSDYKNKEGHDQYRVKLFFVIADEESDFDGEVVSQYFGLSMHPTMSKLYPIVKALLGREPEEDEDLDLDDLVGRSVMGTVGHTTKDKNGVKQTYANLISAAPVRKKKTNKPAPAPEPEPVAADDGIDWNDEDEDAA